MRAKLSVLCALLCSGALGCYNVESEPNEAAAVAEALTRSVRFDGGEVVNSKMPPTNDDSVWLVAPELPTVMSPGETSLMGFDVDGDGASVPADETTTLVEFQGSKRHIRVPNPLFDSADETHVEHSFDVDDAVCDKLCNKQHKVDVMVAIKLGNGAIGRRQSMRFALDCREHGDPDECRSSGGDGAGNSSALAQACQNAVTECKELASAVGAGNGTAQCVETYQCVQSFYSGDSLCRGLVDALVACMGTASSAIECNACAEITSQLSSNCEEPVECLEGGVVIGSDGGVVGPIEAGPAPIDLPLTGSLAENCAVMCNFARQAGCPNYSDTCQMDCEGGFVGHACEFAVVDFQRCIWEMSERTFTCDDTGMPELDPSACPGEMDKLTECLVNNPDSLPAPGVDAGVPGADAGMRAP